MAKKNKLFKGQQDGEDDALGKEVSQEASLLSSQKGESDSSDKPAALEDIKLDGFSASSPSIKAPSSGADLTVAGSAASKNSVSDGTQSVLKVGGEIDEYGSLGYQVLSGSTALAASSEEDSTHWVAKFYNASFGGPLESENYGSGHQLLSTGNQSSDYSSDLSVSGSTEEFDFNAAKMASMHALKTEGFEDINPFFNIGLGAIEGMAYGASFKSSMMINSNTFQGGYDSAYEAAWKSSTSNYKSLIASNTLETSSSSDSSSVSLFVGELPTFGSLSVTEDGSSSVTITMDDSSLAPYIQLSNFQNVSLYQSNGIDLIAEGSFISHDIYKFGIVVKPDANANADVSFDVQVSESSAVAGLYDEAETLSVSVTGVADTPSVSDASTDEDTQSSANLVISRNAADGNEVTHFKITGITGGTLYHNDGSTAISNGDFITFSEGSAGLKFSPSANSTSDGNFTLQASTSDSDAGLAGDTVEATITVNAVNDAPTITLDSPDLASDTDLAFKFDASDIDGDREIGDQPANGANVSVWSDTSENDISTYLQSGQPKYDDDGVDGGASVSFTSDKLRIANNDLINTADHAAKTLAAKFEIDTLDGSFDVIYEQGGTDSGMSIALASNHIYASIWDTSWTGDGEEQYHMLDLGEASTGTPYAVVLIYDGDAGTVKGYLNGSLIQSTSTAGSSLSADEDNIGIGDRQSEGVIPDTLASTNHTSRFYGAIASISEWNRALGADEVDAATRIQGDDPTVAEGGTLTIDDTVLSASDVDNAADELTFTVSNVSGGSVQLSGSNTSSFTQDDIDNDRVTFVSNGNSDVETGGFDYSLVDSSGSAAVTGSIRINVTEVNDAPVLASDAYSLSAVVEDDADPSGDTVATIVGSGITDQDGSASEGIAITATSTDNGAWEYSTDSGSSWTSVGAVAGNSALLLRSTDMLRFVPDSNYNGSDADSVTFRAWDQTSGSAGSKVDASSNGSSTAFSSATDTANVDVSAVADTPSITDASTDEDIQSSAGLVLSRNANDDTEVTHFKITGISGGTLYQNDGTTEISNGDFITFAQGNAGLKFTPSANSFSDGSFTAQASTSADDSGLGGSTVDAAISVSAVADTLSVTDASTNEDTQSSAGLVLSRNANDGTEVTHFKITGISGGTLYQNDGTTEISNGDFITFDQGNAGLKFTPNANSTSDGSFTAQASTSADDSGLGGSTVDATISVSAVNDAPVLASDAYSLSAVVEDDSDPSGDTVATIVGSGISDVDSSASEGIAITATSTDNGAWEYSTDSGSSWTSVGVVAGNSALLLRSTDMLRFVPDSNYNGSDADSVTFRAWDQTSGSAGSKVDASSNGSSTAFSSATDTANVDVSAVADTPSITDASTDEDIQSSAGLVLSRNANDGTEVTHFKITGISGGALYQNDGTTAISNGDFITFAQGNAGLKFTPSANSFSDGSFTAQASTSADDSGLGGSTVDAAISVSAVADTLSVTDASTNEDTQSSAGLVLSRNANDGTEVTHFKIMGISGGTLYQNDGTTAISNGDFISFAQGNAGLKFTPSANSTSDGSFTAQASTSADDSGLGGSTVDATISVSAVNDAPVLASDAYSLSAVTEDDADPSGDTVATIVGSGISDVDSSASEGIAIMAASTDNGAWEYSTDSGSSWTSVGVVAGNSALLLRSTDMLRFVPDSNYNGSDADSVTFRAWDQTSGSAGSKVDASSHGGSSAFSSTTDSIHVDVTAVADTPSITDASTDEDIQSSAGLVLSRNANDDTEVTHFKITGISGGTLYQNDGTTAISNGDFITFAQGNAGLKFTPSANSFSDGSFTAQASTSDADGGLGGSTVDATISVSAVADTLSVTDASTNEDTQSSAGLVLSRNANDGTEVTHFKITGISGGTLYQNDGTTAISNGDFISFAQGNAGLKFTPSANSTSDGSFTAQASTSADDSGLGGSTVDATISVSAVNDAPVLASDAYSLSAVTEDDSDPSGDTVATIVGSGISDVDSSASEGIAITATSTDNGAWEYSTDSGSSWTSVGVVAGNSALLLRSTDMLRFVPDSNYNGSDADSVTFRAWDQTSGSAGSKVDASTNGGSTAFSSTTDTATIHVTPVADTPSVTDASTSEDVQSSAGLVLSRNANDDTEVTHFKITGISGGTLYQNDGTTEISNGDFITFAQGNAGLKFTPSANSFSDGSFTAQASTSADDSGLGGSTVDATISVSAVADTLSVTDASTNEDTQSSAGLVLSRNANDGTEVTHFKITGISGGTLYQNDGTTAISNGDFISFAQGNAGLKFTPSANSTSDGSFTAQASTSADDSGLGGSTVDATISVSAVNDAPVLASDAYSLSAVTEDDSDPSGDTVATIVGSGISDVDSSASEGIAITAASTDNGAWEYSTDSGSSWSSVGVVAGNSALLLRSTDMLRFVPDSNYNGSDADSVTFRAWDQTSGSAGSKVDASTNGGSTAFSSTTDTATIHVTPVADTPSVTDASTSEDVQSSAGLVLSRNANDDTEVTHFKITGISGGTLYQNDGTTEISNGDFITFAQGNAGLKFTPSANSFSDGSFTAQASTSADDSGLGGSTVDAAISVSAVADTLSVTDASTNEDTQSSAGLVLSRNANDGTEVTHFKITGISGGTLYQNDGTTAISNGDFISFAQGNAGLKFTPSANSTSDGSFTAQASTSADDSGLGGSTVDATISVSAVNDAPVLASDAYSLSAVVEDDSDPSGDTVAAIVGSGISDVDSGASEGIAITATSTDNGAWEYSTDSGSSWSSVGVVAGNSALLLRSTDMLRFVPDSNYNGSDADSVTFRAWDQTSGSAGSKVDASSHGGSSAFSSTTDSIHVDVTAVADTLSITDASTNEDTQSSAGLVLSRNANDGTEVTHFKITGISGGTLYQNDGTTEISNGDFITFAQGNAGLKFTPSANSFSDGGFTAQASTSDADGGLGGSTVDAAISVSAVADTLSVTDASTNEDTQSSAGLVLSRNANDGTEVTHFKITGISGGTLYQNDGTTAISNGDFISFAQGNAGLKFTPSANSTSDGSFTAQASTSADDSGLGGSTVDATISVSAVNDAPVLASDAYSLSAVTEDDADPSGDTVATIVGSGISDVDSSASEGIAITATSTDNGAWEYSTDSGSSWSSVGVVAGNSALLLRSTDMLRFVPDANYNGNSADSFTFRAWDQTSGSAGSKVDASSNGSSTAFSSTTDTANVDVSAVADTPSITDASTDEDIQSSAGLVLSRSGNDGTEVTHFKITGISGGALYQNDGTTAISNGDFITFAQGNAGLKFTPSANSFSDGSFTAQASTSDADGGLGGSTVDATISVSAVADTLSVTDASTNEDTQSSAGLVLSRNANDGTEVTHFKITGISGGMLYQNDGTTAISNGDFISFAQGNAGLKFSPTADSTSDGSFTAQASTSDADGGLGGSTVDATISVTAVNDQLSMDDLPIVDPAISANDSSLIFRFDAHDIDADGDQSDQPSDGADVTTWSDLSGNGNDALQVTVNPVPDYNATNVAVDFNGADTGWKMNDAGAINSNSHGERSIAVTFTTGDDISSGQVIYEEGGAGKGFNILITGDHAYVGAFSEADWVGEEYNFVDLGELLTNTTYTAVMTFDSSYVYGYLDGVLKGSDDVGGNMGPHGNNIGIGRVMGSTSNIDGTSLDSSSYFDGSLISLAAWNRTLSAAEIAANNSISDSGVLTVTNDLLNAADVDDGAANITYTVTSTTGGTLYRWDDGSSTTSFTQHDIDNNLIYFQESGSANTASFDYSVADGGEDGTSAVTGTLTFSVVGSEIVAGSAGDTVYGTEASEQISGTTGAETLYGYGGDDRLIGGSGTDTLYGGDGNDSLQGEVMYGEGGNDILEYNTGSSSVFDGGAGNNDILLLDDSFSSTTIDYASSQTITAIERINLTGDQEGAANTLANLTVDDVLTSSNNTLYVDGDNDVVTTSDSWSSEGTVTMNGVSYDKYTATSGEDTATLYVDSDLTQTGF